MCVIKLTAIFKENLSVAVSVGGCLWLRILKSAPKLSKILAVMRHYKKMSVMKQFLWKVTFLYFVRWPITATAIAKRNTVNKEILRNKWGLLSLKKGLVTKKKDLLTQKEGLLTYAKKKPQKTRQILTANIR